MQPKKAYSITVHLDRAKRDEIVRLAQSAGLKNSVFIGDVIIDGYLSQIHQQCLEKGGEKSPVLINRNVLKRGLQKSPVIADRAFVWFRNTFSALV